MKFCRHCKKEFESPDWRRKYCGPECASSCRIIAARENAKKWSAQNPDRVRANVKRWRGANPDLVATYRKGWAERNPEKAKEIARRASQAWSLENPKRRNAYQNQRRALKIMACPPWVGKEELSQIYEGCPKGHHVDHIIPLKHDLVCGLHVPWNLQYLSPEGNRRKSNKFTPFSRDLGAGNE